MTQLTLILTRDGDIGHLQLIDSDGMRVESHLLFGAETMDDTIRRTYKMAADANDRLAEYRKAQGHYHKVMNDAKDLIRSRE